MDQFLQDVLKGLQAKPKYLQSKYFYDKKGDEIFQRIMASDDYYLTDSEMEIFVTKKDKIADAVMGHIPHADVVEFGPGDATKSIYLIKELFSRNALKTYFPIDISENIIEVLAKKITAQIPGIQLHSLNGEYFEMLSQLKKHSSHKKLLLFLGANIGNFKFDETIPFCKKLHELLNPGDLVLIGFDLKKDPKKILAAYNDAAGLTTQFNLNLLSRINEELHSDIDVNSFEHYATYDPGTGACKSYLVCMKEQEIHLGNTTIHFNKDETIFMEISQKYTVEQIDQLGQQCGFAHVGYFFDQQKYFTDVLWRCEM